MTAETSKIAPLSPAQPAEADLPRPGLRHRQLGLSRKMRTRIIGAAGAVLLVFFANWVYQRATHIYAHDARIVADIVSISSRTSGWVNEIPIREGSRVAEGDVLVLIDRRDSELRFRDIEAQIKATDAEKAEMAAEISMTDSQTESRTEIQSSMLSAAQAALAAQESELKLVQGDYERSTSLLERKVISRQKWEGDRNRFQRAQEDYRRIAANADSARATLSEARAGRQKIGVLQQKLQALEHRREQLLSQLERQQLDMEDRTLRAPFAGVIDRTFIKPGEFVAPGQRLLMLHDPQKIWVEANIKETEIRHIKLGDKAILSIDAYPGKHISGTVSWVGTAATSQFALLPNPNPSGNFTKITQRLPVRIDISETDGLLRPGMMVEVEIKLD